MKVGITRHFAPINIHLTFETQREVETFLETLRLAVDHEERAACKESGLISNVQQFARDLIQRFKEEANW